MIWSCVQRSARLFTILFSVTLTLTGASQAQAQRETIRIVGSSTMYPYLAQVAETFTRSTSYKSPVIEATGSVGGFKIFCNDVSLNSPDIVASSRRMTPLEEEHCLANEVVGVAEFKLGYDGIVIAQSRKGDPFDLSRASLWRALSKTVLNRKRQILNPYQSWADIQPAFPDYSIRVFGPPLTSGTRDVFVHLVMNPGCDTLPVSASNHDVAEACGHIREDGKYINAGEDDAMLVNRLVDDPKALAILGYGALKRHREQISGLPIEGIAPTDETLENGQYPLSRPLYVYVKTAHIGRVNGLMGYMEQLLSDEAIGNYGTLLDLGLIPMSDDERFFVQSSFKALRERMDK